MKQTNILITADTGNNNIFNNILETHSNYKCRHGRKHSLRKDARDSEGLVLGGEIEIIQFELEGVGFSNNISKGPRKFRVNLTSTPIPSTP